MVTQSQIQHWVDRINTKNNMLNYISIIHSNSFDTRKKLKISFITIQNGFSKSTLFLAVIPQFKDLFGRRLSIFLEISLNIFMMNKVFE